MSDQYEDDEEDGVEFVGHYDRFFKNITDPEVNREVKEKEADIIQQINSVREYQLNILAQREKFAKTYDGITPQQLLQTASDNSENKTTRKKEEPEIPVSEVARKIFENTLEKDRPLVDYLRFQSIQELTSKNEYLTLCFIGARSINLLSPIACIKEEQWIHGVKNNYDLYTKPLTVKPRSRYDAIVGLTGKEIIFKKNFHDKRGIYYFLNTENGKKIYDLVDKGTLKRDDLDKLNNLLFKKLLHALDPKLIEKFLQFRSAKLADLSSENYYKDRHYFQDIPAYPAEQNEGETKTYKESQHSLPIDHPKESPIVTSLDPDPDMTSGKNPSGDLSEGDKIRLLESRLSRWKKSVDELNYLIATFSLPAVYTKTIELEEKDRAGLIIPKIVSFYPYLERALKNDKIKADKSKSKASGKSKKQASKPDEPKEKPLEQKYLELFRLFSPELTQPTMKGNWDAVSNAFIETLKNKCELKEVIFISETIPKIKKIVHGPELEKLLLNCNLADEEVEKIFKFLKEN